MRFVMERRGFFERQNYLRDLGIKRNPVIGSKKNRDRVTDVQPGLYYGKNVGGIILRRLLRLLSCCGKRFERLRRLQIFRAISRFEHVVRG